MFWHVMLGLFYVGDAALFFGLGVRYVLGNRRSR